MLASLVDRVQSVEARSVRADSTLAEPDRRRVVAAFEHRLLAERAVGALLDIGLASDQIRLEGPAAPRRERSGPIPVAGLAWVVLLGAATLATGPAGQSGWHRVALGLPTLALSLLAALTAAANPRGVEVFPWTVDVAPARRRSDVRGHLRAFGGRGVYLS
jgi:hypothetical protein